MTLDGSLLGVAGETTYKVKTKVIGAIVSNVWSDYHKSCQRVVQNKPIEFISIKTEQNAIGIMPAGVGYLLCVVAKENAKQSISTMKKHVSMIIQPNIHIFSLIKYKTQLETYAEYFGKSLAMVQAN